MAEAKGVSKIALVSESSPLPEPTWWGLPQDLGAANRKVGCPCAGGPTQEGPWRATWGAGALLPQCYFSSEQALSDPLIKAEFSCKPPEDKVQMVNGSLMETHSTAFAYKIPWTEEPGRLQSMGLLRVRHD